MNQNKKNAYLSLFFWGVSAIGLLWVLIFLGAVAKFLFFQQKILWGRNVILLVAGLLFLFFGVKSLKKYEKRG